jgi:hypothetical protein
MSFLDNLTREKIENDVFPLKEILENSLYYPSSAFDGGVVKDCNTLGRSFKIENFIYCDYSVGEENFWVEQDTFYGYHVFGSRNLTHSDLTPNGWIQVFPPGFSFHDYYLCRDYWKKFINWTVYERDPSQGENHGPKRFSVLYLGGEGVATYQALFWTNNFFPKALAIIQPGTNNGLNWTDFTNYNGPLAWVVKENPAGQPNIIYYGGHGEHNIILNWPGFAQIREISPYYNFNGRVGVWERQN